LKKHGTKESCMASSVVWFHMVNESS